LTPFYSNCDLTSIQNFTSLFVNYYSSWPHTFKIVTNPTPGDILTGQDVHERHYVSANCFTNLEPEWLYMKYWVNSTVRTVPNIPFGYKLDQFTINANGSLSSSLEFLYTSAWVNVYSIQRISSNKIIVDEVSQLDGDSVLFHLSGTQVVDESDSFFGEGNNGRDCVRLQAAYDYNILDCFFQNNQKAYTSTQYLSGKTKTTGIARFIDKFSLSVFQNTGPFDYSFKLTPKNDSDFSFHIETDGFICPKVLTTTTFTNGCQTTLFYSGPSPITLSNPTRTIEMVNNSATVQLTFGGTLISAGALGCVILTCQNNLEVSTVRIQTPNVQIISQSDLDLQSRVDFYFHEYANSINNMSGIHAELDSIQDTISELLKNLSALNFNVSEQFPYDNNTNLTELAAALAAKISTTSEGCGSPFSSIGCAFEHIAATIIFFICIMLVLGVLYYILWRYNVLPYTVTIQRNPNRLTKGAEDDKLQPIGVPPVTDIPVPLQDGKTPATHFLLPSSERG